MIYGSDFGIIDGAFAGDVIFGSIFASRADIIATEIEGGDDEYGVVVPSGYAPGAQVEVQVINAEGLQSPLDLYLWTEWGGRYSHQTRFTHTSELGNYTTSKHLDYRYFV